MPTCQKKGCLCSYYTFHLCPPTSLVCSGQIKSLSGISDRRNWQDHCLCQNASLTFPQTLESENENPPFHGQRVIFSTEFLPIPNIPYPQESPLVSSVSRPHVSKDDSSDKHPQGEGYSISSSLQQKQNGQIQPSSFDQAGQG